MTNSWHTTIITLMPEMYPGPLGCSLVGDALSKGLWSLEVLNLRDYGIGKHSQVDDSPYGGGAGMVIKPDVADAAILAAYHSLPLAGREDDVEYGTNVHSESAACSVVPSPLRGGLGRGAMDSPQPDRSPPPQPSPQGGGSLLSQPPVRRPQLIHFSPRGERLSQPLLRELSQVPLILFCGRYEAVDERVLEKHRPREISLGDFVLTGGDIPAMALIDGCVRLLPGVIGKEESLGEESFGEGAYANLLEYPHYTKPAVWEGRAVPEILTSGHHANVAKWRKAQAEAITKARRPDLFF